MRILIALLSEDGTPEGLSTMRVATLFVTVCVCGAWAVVSVMRGELQPISIEMAALVLGSHGAKAWQRGREISDPTPNQ